MSLFSWFSRKLSFNEYADSIGLKRTGLNTAVCEIVSQRLALSELVFVVAQFPATFLQMQEALDELKVAFRIQAEPIDHDRLEQLVMQIPSGQAVLTLGEMFSNLPMSQLQYATNAKISVIVVERHPLGDCDDAIVRSVQQFPYPTSIGFFLALDDPLLEPMNADWVGHLLRQMGATENELISSHMVSRRVRAVQRRMKNQMIANKQCDSAESWMKENLEGE